MGKRGLSCKDSQASISVQTPITGISLGVIWWYVLCSCISVYAADFAILPQVLDDTTEIDAVFSPNGDSIQDKVVIVFEMDGTTGEYEIIIDVHGPGGVGKPDGQFNVEDDWSVFGKFGPGVTINDAPKRFRIEWDGRDSAAGIGKTVTDGNYQLRLQVDFFQNEILDPIQDSHTQIFPIIVDTESPQTSAKLERTDFSPNSDGNRDQLSINYVLGEQLSSLELLIPNYSSIQLSDLLVGNQFFSWNGQEGLGAVLPDNSYNLQLRSLDLAGNERIVSLEQIWIDTKKPTISQIIPSLDAKVSTTVNELIATFESGTGSQIDFDNSIISLADLDGTIQNGTISYENMILTLALDNPLDLASENGLYTVNVQAIDLAGNREVSTTNLVFDTIQPSVLQIRLDEDNLRNRDYVNSSISYIEADLNDALSGLDLASSLLQLSKSGTVVDGVQLQIDPDTIRFQLSRALKSDGSDDGTYQIMLTAVDTAGNSQVQTHPLVYDTTAPTLTGTNPPDLSQEKVRIDQALSTIELTFSDQNDSVVASGLNFDQTAAFVNKSDGTSVSTIKQVNSPSNLALHFAGSLTAGDYTLSVIAKDKAGNQGKEINYPFYIDLRAPEIQFIPNNVPVATLETVSAQLVNYNGIGLDLAKSSLLVKDISGNTIPSQRTEIVEQSLVWHIKNQLPKNGTQDGDYIVTANFADFEGRTYTASSTLTVDTLPPTIDKTLPVDGSKVSALKEVDVFLNDNLSGISFSQTDVLLSSDNGTISTTKSDNGDNHIRLTFTDRHTDGSADGLYTIAITAVDLAGNISGTQSVSFYLVTQKPEIISVTPSASSRINHLSTISASLLDLSGKGIDFDQTTITLSNSNGAVLGETSLTYTDSQITLTGIKLPTDGSADGMYTILITLVDKLGSTVEKLQKIYYDTLPPVIGTSDQSFERLLTDEVAVSFEVVDSGSGIDITNSSLQLSNTDGTVVPGQFSYDGTGNLGYKSAKLNVSGIYMLQVVLTDQASNSSVPYTFYYAYGVELAEVVEVTPRLTNNLETVVASFKSQQNIDFEQTIFELRNPNQQFVPGVMTNDGQQRITFTPSIPLAVDGSQDGAYALTIQPSVMAIGRSDKKWSGEITFDTQPPEVKSISYITQPEQLAVDLQGTVVGLPTRFQLVLADTVSGIDGQQTTAQLISPTGQVSTTKSLKADIETNEYSINLSLNSQPKPDPSVNGDYVLEIIAVDLAGNSTTYNRSFTVMWEAVTVSSTQPASFSKLNELQRVDVVLENMAETEIKKMTTVRLVNPDGSEVVGRQEVVGTMVSWVLDQPLPQDGTADGAYTIQSTVLKNNQVLLSENTTFLYDTKSPRVDSIVLQTNELTELKPSQVVMVTEPFSAITIKIVDQLAGTDLITSTVSLRTSEGNGTDEVLEVKNNGTDTITVEFAELKLTGIYTLVVTPKDLAGNVGHPSLYQINLNLSKPKLTSIKISDRLRLVTAELANATAEYSTIEVVGPNGQVIGKTTEDNLKKQITWTPTNLAQDGTDDGAYTITVTPVNKQGVSGQVLVKRFTYDTQEPEIINITAVDITQPVSYLSNPTAQITATVSDLGPAGLDTEQQKITLIDSSGQTVSAFLTHDGRENLYFTFNPSFAKDGTNDGEYQLIINLIDKAGNKKDFTHSVFYDSSPPTLTDITPDDGALLKGKINQVTVNLADKNGSGIDFSLTTISVTDTESNSVSGQISHDGRSKIIFKIDDLAPSGSYLVRVEVADRAGNQAIFESGFTNLSNLLVASSTTPVTRPIEKAFSRKQLDSVTVQLPKDVGTHLSTLHLVDSSGQVVMGYQDRNSLSDLQYQLQKPLKDDGSDDGTYTIVFTPISANGQRGQPQLMSFVHDTVAPEIDDSQIRLNVAQAGVNNSLVSIQLPVYDPSPSSGIDWLERPLPIAITLESFEKENIAGRILVESDKEEVTFVLNKPLASDGSQDGKYKLKVDVTDQAGNDLNWIYDFDYDTRPPEIQASDLQINGQPLIVDANHIDYPSVAGRGGSVIITAKIKDTDGLGVDLSTSSINVISPSGETITGSLTQNGIDFLVFSSSQLLPNQGYYRVVITSVGLDPQNLGFQPTKTISTEFLYETLPPVASLTDSGKDKIEEGDALTLKGVASDPDSQEIPASGVSRVEIVGSGPNGKAIEPALAVDTSKGGSNQWSSWKIDYLPPKSGRYVLSVRVYDKAGNAETYEKKDVTFTVSLGFKGETFCWPNPVSLSASSSSSVAYISFDPNIADTANLTLSIYDLSGDLVYRHKEPNIKPGRQDTTLKWNLSNSSGSKVARGIYLFRLEIVNGEDESSNTVGKILVVE